MIIDVFEQAFEESKMVHDKKTKTRKTVKLLLSWCCLLLEVNMSSDSTPVLLGIDVRRMPLWPHL